MSEEQVSSGMPTGDFAPVIDQGDIIDNYLNDYTLVDDSNDEDVNPEPTPSPEATPEGQPTQTPEEGKPEGAEDANNQQPATSKTLAEMKEIPQGFMSNFFSKGEDGAVNYSRESVLKAMTPNNNYKYSNARQFAENTAPEAPKSPEEQRQAKLQEIMDYETNLNSNMNLGLQRYGQLVGQGYDPNTALQMAQQEVQRIVGEEIKKNNYQRQLDLEGNITKDFETRQQKEAKIAQASSNENLLVNQMVDQFGLKASDTAQNFANLRKLMQEYAGDYINEMFDMMNPDTMKGLTKEQYTEKMNDWWYGEIASDQRRLNMVYDIAINNLNRAMLPYNMEQSLMNQGNLNAQNKLANVRPPSNVNRTAPAPSGDMERTMRVLGYPGQGNDFT